MNKIAEEQTMTAPKKLNNEIDLRQIAGALSRKRQLIAGGGAWAFPLRVTVITKPIYQVNFKSFLVRDVTKRCRRPALAESALAALAA